MRKVAGKYVSEETQRFGAGRFWPTWLIENPPEMDVSLSNCRLHPQEGYNL
jgi:hypothetical protein